MECQPGEEMQVDFCLGAPIEQEGGKRRRSWVLRAVLSYSRKGYSEAVMRQDSESFLRCLENALRHFGGVPLLLNLDNFKAAVLKADWFDPADQPEAGGVLPPLPPPRDALPSADAATQGKGGARGVLRPRQRAQRATLPVPGRRKRFSRAAGKKTSPTNAFTARPANRSSHALQRNAPICSRCPLRSFPATRRPVAT